MKKDNSQDTKQLNKTLEKHLSSKPSHNAFFVDGGGAKGVFAAEIIDIIGKKRYQKFNILAGTSIGGIIILAYAMFEFDAVKAIMIKRLKQIFTANCLQKFWNLLTQKSFYNNKRKKQVLQLTFGDLKVSNLPKDKAFFITTTNFKYGKPVVIENVSGIWDDTYLWEVAHYTSDAPLYFNNTSSQYVDGGVYANDPRTIFRGLKKEELITNRINLFLSIGLSPMFREISDEQLRKGWIAKFPRLLDLLTNVNALNNDKWFESQINKKHLRIVFNSKKKDIALDNVTPEFFKLAVDDARDNKPKLEKFLKNL